MPLIKPGPFFRLEAAVWGRAAGALRSSVAPALGQRPVGAGLAPGDLARAGPPVGPARRAPAWGGQPEAELPDRQAQPGPFRREKGRPAQPPGQHPAPQPASLQQGPPSAALAAAP